MFEQSWRALNESFYDANFHGANWKAVRAKYEPLVAHVRDLSTGEIGIFNGTREVVFNDPQLAARLFRAAQ